MPVPRISSLSSNEIELVNSEALRLLQEVGMQIGNQDASNILIGNGCTLKDGRVMIPESVIKEALSRVPSNFDLFDREGKKVTTIGSGSMLFDPGSAAIQILDYGNTVPRTPTLNDLKNVVILVDYLKNIGAQSTALVPDDVPLQIRDAVRLYVVLKYSSKPFITGAFTVANIRIMFEMMKAVRKDFDERPWGIFDVTSSSPLSWSNVSASNLIDLTKSRVPAEIISMPQMGATSPATIAGSLIQHHAEVLSGIAIAEFTNPNSPVIYGGSTAVLHPKYAIPMITAPESILLTLSYREMAKFVRVPSHTYMGIGDGKLVDFQTGGETLYSAALASLAGFDVISGPGMLGNELVQSLEKLVLDDEVVGIAKRLARGYELGEEERAFDVVKNVIAGNTHNYFGQRHTKKFVRQEFYSTSVWDTTVRASWNKKDAYERAKEIVDKVFKEYNPTRLDSKPQKELDEVNDTLWRNVGSSPALV